MRSLFFLGLLLGSSSTQVPITVHFAGCTDVLVGPICLITAQSHLLFWADTTDAFVVRVDGSEVPVTPIKVDGGQRFELDLANKTQVVEVVAQSVWQLKVAPRETALDAEEVAFYDSLSENDLSQLAADLQARSDLTPLDQARATVLRARIAWRIDSDQTVPLIEQAILAADQAGLLSESYKRRLALAFTLTNRRDYVQADKWLTDVGELAPYYAEGQSRLPYMRQHLSGQTGNLRAALRFLDETDRWVEQLGPKFPMEDTASERANFFAELGRFADALAIIPQPGDDPCQRAKILANLGWILILQRIAGAPTIEDSVSLSAEALALYQGECPRVTAAESVRNNLARAHLLNGDTTRAVAILSTHKELKDESNNKHTQISLERESIYALIAEADQRWSDALFRWAILSKHAAPNPFMHWNSYLGQARSLEGLGRLQDAWNAYEVAEILLDEINRDVPIYGRNIFLSTHTLGTQRYVDLLLRLDEHEAAFKVALTAHTRGISQRLTQAQINSLPIPLQKQRLHDLTILAKQRKIIQDLWGTPQNHLRMQQDLAQAQAIYQKKLDNILGVLDLPIHIPEPNELTLFYTAIPDGWVGFAQTVDGIRAKRLEAMPKPTAPDTEWAHVLLAPFTDEIQNSESLRVITQGALLPIDIHTLPFDGAPLLARLSVSYGGYGGLATQRPHGEVAMVVDPEHRIPAGREAALTHRIELSRHAPVTTLGFKGAEATVSHTLAVLKTAHVFHYFGHAEFDGLEGWESHLQMADGPLTVGDIALAGPTPPWVILAGCETGLTAEKHGLIGLAQAFLASGSHAVIATTRKVDAADAAALVTAIYQSWPKNGDLLDAFRSGMMIFQHSHPQSDWSAFRIFAP